MEDGQMLRDQLAGHLLRRVLASVRALAPERAADSMTANGALAVAEPICL